MEISDKVFIVTGASSGIGLATAVALTGRGAKVALVARSSDALQTLAGTLSGSLAIPLRNLRSLRRLRAKLCSTTSCSSASNRALLGFSMTARMELQKDGIVVSEVYPYITATNFGKARLGSSDADAPASNYADGDKPEFVASLILKAIEEGQGQYFANDRLKKLAGQ